MTSAIDSSTGMNWLGSATRPVVGDHGGDREQQRDERGDGGAEDQQQDHERERERDHAGLGQHELKAASVALVVVTLPTWLTSKPGCSAAVLSRAELILSM